LGLSKGLGRVRPVANLTQESNAGYVGAFLDGKAANRAYSDRPSIALRPAFVILRRATLTIRLCTFTGSRRAVARPSRTRPANMSTLNPCASVYLIPTCAVEGGVDNA